MNKLVNMEPFYFRSYYHCIKGVAHNRSELETELKRLKEVDPGCVQYHLDQKHISNWLKSIGESEAADNLEKAGTIVQAIKAISKKDTPKTRKAPTTKRESTGRMAAEKKPDIKR